VPVDPTPITPSPSSAAPVIGAEGMILEGLITTLDADGQPHLAPMGPIVDARLDRLWLRPFDTSITFANLKRARAGVFHVTDDVELIARAAVGAAAPLPRLIPATGVTGVILADACRWYAFEVESIDESGERTSVVARVVGRGVQRDFFGFNRAKHAVVEAAILATRIHILPCQEIGAELARLAAPVIKTGGAAERRAFEFLQTYVLDAIESAHR
jgi:hypothetical protein